MKDGRRLRPLLRPPLGRRLPPELRAARVGELARALPGGLSDPMLQTLLQRIDQAPIMAGNTIELYVRGDRAFAAMLADIDAAREEILLEVYVMHGDGAGKRMKEALAAAVERGVAVRLLVDAYGSWATSGAFWSGLAHDGVDLRLFHPLLRGWSFRDHRKVLVVDRKVAYTGGMNIGDEYAGADDDGSWRDTHARVEGPTAWEMAIVFSEGWHAAGGAPLQIAPLPVTAGAGAAILVLDSWPMRGQREAASVLATLVGAARRYIYITNAYFAPGHAAVDALDDAAARGLDVRLLLPGKTNHPLVRHAGHGWYRHLLERGVRIFEYQASVLHAKTLVADDGVAVVGSTNLDFRSFNVNGECNWVVFDPATAARLRAAFEDDLGRAAPVELSSWGARSPAHRALDRAARWCSPLL